MTVVVGFVMVIHVGSRPVWLVRAGQCTDDVVRAVLRENAAHASVGLETVPGPASVASAVSTAVGLSDPSAATGRPASAPATPGAMPHSALQTKATPMGKQYSVPTTALSAGLTLSSKGCAFSLMLADFILRRTAYGKARRVAMPPGWPPQEAAAAAASVGASTRSVMSSTSLEGAPHDRKFPAAGHGAAAAASSRATGAPAMPIVTAASVARRILESGGRPHIQPISVRHAGDVTAASDDARRGVDSPVVHAVGLAATGAAYNEAPTFSFHGSDGGGVEAAAHSVTAAPLPGPAVTRPLVARRFVTHVSLSDTVRPIRVVSPHSAAVLEAHSATEDADFNVRRRSGFAVNGSSVHNLTISADAAPVRMHDVSVGVAVPNASTSTSASLALAGGVSSKLSPSASGRMTPLATLQARAAAGGGDAFVRKRVVHRAGTGMSVSTSTLGVAPSSERPLSHAGNDPQSVARAMVDTAVSRDITVRDDVSLASGASLSSLIGVTTSHAADPRDDLSSREHFDVALGASDRDSEGDAARRKLRMGGDDDGDSVNVVRNLMAGDGDSDGDTIDAEDDGVLVSAPIAVQEGHYDRLKHASAAAAVSRSASVTEGAAQATGAAESDHSPPVTSTDAPAAAEAAELLHKSSGNEPALGAGVKAFAKLHEQELLVFDASPVGAFLGLCCTSESSYMLSSHNSLHTTGTLRHRSPHKYTSKNAANSGPLAVRPSTHERT